MKKTVLSVLMSLFAFAALYAQPTMTAANGNPVFGETFYARYLDTLGIDKGAGGAHATWSFPVLSAMNYDTSIYMACDSTPACGSIIGSNIAYLNYGDYYYCNANANAFSLVGVYANFTGSGYSSLNFIDKQDMIRYPFTYNSSYVDTVTAYVSSLALYHREVDSFVCDGYGTITLPSGTDTNAIRIHGIFHTFDSMGTSAGTYARYETYVWYKPGFHNPFFSLTYDTAGSTTGQMYLSEAIFYKLKPNKLSITDANNINAGLNCAPNPASDELHIRFNLDQAAGAFVTVSDLLGRTVKTISNDQMVAGNNNISLSVNDLPNGMYLVKLQTENGVESQKVVISK